jgi:hypothetical protein
LGGPVEASPNLASTSEIFSPSVIASSTVILAPHTHISGSTPTVLRRSSAHGSQYSAGARPADGLPVGGGSESLGSLKAARRSSTVIDSLMILRRSETAVLSQHEIAISES